MYVTFKRNIQCMTVCICNENLKSISSMVLKRVVSDSFLCSQVFTVFGCLFELQKLHRVVSRHEGALLKVRITCILSVSLHAWQTYDGDYFVRIADL